VNLTKPKKYLIKAAKKKIIKYCANKAIYEFKAGHPRQSISSLLPYCPKNNEICEQLLFLYENQKLEIDAYAVTKLLCKKNIIKYCFKQALYLYKSNKTKKSLKIYLKICKLNYLNACYEIAKHLLSKKKLKKAKVYYKKACTLNHYLSCSFLVYLKIKHNININNKVIKKACLLGDYPIACLISLSKSHKSYELHYENYPVIHILDNGLIIVKSKKYSFYSTNQKGWLKCQKNKCTAHHASLLFNIPKPSCLGVLKKKKPWKTYSIKSFQYQCSSNLNIDFLNFSIKKYYTGTPKPLPQKNILKQIFFKNKNYVKLLKFKSYKTKNIQIENLISKNIQKISPLNYRQNFLHLNKVKDKFYKSLKPIHDKSKLKIWSGIIKELQNDNEIKCQFKTKSYQAIYKCLKNKPQYLSRVQLNIREFMNWTNWNFHKNIHLKLFGIF